MTVETGGLPWWLFLYLLVTVAAGKGSALARDAEH